ncbi:MAG: hypothetical protein ABIF71_10950 [Planctomycetota bacterium]
MTGTLTGVGPEAEISLRIQDPVDPRRELAGADFRLAGPGPVHIIMDVSDRIIPPGRRLWLSLSLPAGAVLGGAAGAGAEMELFTVPRDAARAECLRDAVFLLKTYFDRGLNRHAMDPLHAYEEGMNQIALMGWWRYGDPVRLEACMESARSAVKITTVTAAGHRHFRNQEMGTADLRFERPLEKDGHAHFLIMHPAFEVARYNGNPGLIKALREWLDGWLDRTLGPHRRHQRRGGNFAGLRRQPQTHAEDQRVRQRHETLGPLAPALAGDRYRLGRV